MNEIKFDTTQQYVVELLKVLDTTGARVVTQEGKDLVILFDISSQELQDRCDAAAEAVEVAGFVQPAARSSYDTYSC